MHDLLDLSLTGLVGQLRLKKASPVDLMAAVPDRIDARNSESNAFVAMHDRDELMSHARDAEAHLARGEGRALEGVPLGVRIPRRRSGCRTPMEVWSTRTTSRCATRCWSPNEAIVPTTQELTIAHFSRR